MAHFQQTLVNLAKTFTVRDIMVPEKKLVRGHDEIDASRLLDEFPEFDVIPVPKSGEITGFVDRGNRTLHKVTKNDLVSDGTSVLDLVDVVALNRHVFVLVGQSVGGYVHFSDLNGHLVKIPFFVLVEAVEAKLSEIIAPRLSEALLREKLGQRAFGQFSHRAEGLQKEKANLNWASALYFSQVLDLAAELNVVELTREEMNTLICVRNRVDHATGELVERFEDVASLASARRTCSKLLGTR